MTFLLTKFAIYYQIIISVSLRQRCLLRSRSFTTVLSQFYFGSVDNEGEGQDKNIFVKFSEKFSVQLLVVHLAGRRTLFLSAGPGGKLKIGPPVKPSKSKKAEPKLGYSLSHSPIVSML